MPLLENYPVSVFLYWSMISTCEYKWPPGVYPLDKTKNYQRLKGLAMIFANQKTPFIIFRGKEIYYIFQNK